MEGINKREGGAHELCHAEKYVNTFVARFFTVYFFSLQAIATYRSLDNPKLYRIRFYNETFENNKKKRFQK